MATQQPRAKNSDIDVGIWKRDMDSLDGLDVSIINEVDISLLLNSRLLLKADIYLILFSLFQFWE